VKEGGVSLVWDNALPVASPTRPLVTNYNATLLSSSGVVLGSAQVPPDTYGYAIQGGGPGAVGWAGMWGQSGSTLGPETYIRVVGGQYSEDFYQGTPSNTGQSSYNSSHSANSNANSDGGTPQCHVA